jgi:hypothetical protein
MIQSRSSPSASAASVTVPPSVGPAAAVDPDSSARMWSVGNAARNEAMMSSSARVSTSVTTSWALLGMIRSMRS